MKMFTLRDPLDRTALRLSVGAENATIWTAAVRGEPVRTLAGQQYTGGTRCKDFLWTALGTTPLINDRVFGLLTANGITGWRTYDILVRDAACNEIKGYRGLGITGRCGGRIDFDQHESAIIYKPASNGSPKPWFKGLRFDESTRDGSDMFMDREGTGWILVTEKVSTVFKRNKVTNCAVRDIQSIELLAMESEIIRT